ncbi:MAG: 2-oxoacid:acceptor oxidoreductase family protein [Gammaproteobacteria bacterium]|nr:2-oxoacid:acceptor oxidoreductase family protein [Gammaproteobacteria bacterium]
MKKQTTAIKYPGIRQAIDGNTAVIMCEREASDAAGAYPITPSTQMGEYWAEEVSKGHINVSGRPLIFVEPESEHAAAAVTAGMSMSGLRATNFSSAQGVAFMHESLYAAVGKRLPYVLNIGCRAITKASLNVHCGHDDYHCIDDTGFFQVMAKSAQEAADLNLIGRKIAELSLTPAAVAQDGFLTTHLIESMQVPERELIKEFLGQPDDIIDTPTPSQRMIYGDKRRRVPEVWDVDNPMLSGSVQNQDAYMQSVAAQRPYFFEHISSITDDVMKQYAGLTGRQYQRVASYRAEDADYLILGQGSMIVQAEAIADYLRKTRKLKVGVVNITMYRPFPGDLLGHVLKGKKAVTVLERTDQPLAEDLPLMREVRAVISKCLENQVGRGEDKPYPAYDTYARPADRPRLYSGVYGLGSRDLQPEALIGAVENMLPEGKRRRFFYLSVDFIHDQAMTPKQEIHQQALLDAYPRIRELAVHGSENPNLMPKNSITVRIHSVGGWGAITTGKNLAMTLFDLLDYEIKANPKYGSEKKGQPTTYYLSAAPEPIPLNCEYHHVDVVLSPDPNVFEHSNPLAGLDKGGAFIIQSSLDSAEEVWAHIPQHGQQYIVDNDIHVYYVDGFRIAREEASNAELQFRMQGNAFQGAFFATSKAMKQAGLDEESLLKAIEDQLRSKFGDKGKRVVEDNLRVVRRGFDEIHEITDKPLGLTRDHIKRRAAGLPVMLKQLPAGDGHASDVHRFWEQTGHFYATGKGNDNLVDPFMGVSLIPAATGVYRDMTKIRFEHPEFIPEKCTACGDCFSTCPDAAIPGLVNTMSDVFNTVIRRIENNGRPTRHLRRATRTVEKKLHAAIDEAGESANVAHLLQQAIEQTVEESVMEVDGKQQLETEFDWFLESMGNFRFAITKPYYTVREKRSKGSGGLFSITINPYTCKGCMECVTVCKDGALEAVTQTTESVESLRHDWQLWLDLPNTSADFIRIDDIDEKVGALETLLLDKRNYQSMVCGDGACLGCGEKTAIHLFTGTVTALMQPRVQKHVKHLDDLIEQLGRHIRIKIADTMDLGDTHAIYQALEQQGDSDLTLARLSATLDSEHDLLPIDPDWLRWATQLLEKLRYLKWQYTDGKTHMGRANLGFINATGCTSVWGSTFPYNPYPFPWSNHLFQDSPSIAMGIFEGHMTKMAEGFKVVRMAELELQGKYNPREHDEFFARFDWRQFNDEEFHLCPPVVSVGGDGAMYDIGFQNLSRMMMAGRPIKALVLDTQVYSNTGGQACTSGFIGQVSDMAPYGKAWHGKTETRKEISLIAMAHRTTYVLQSSMSHMTHLLEGFIEGLNSRRPALFNLYSVCQPEHGVADDATDMQSRLAVESRAYPLFKFDPDLATNFRDCIDIDGNPAMDDDWPTVKIEYVDNDGNAQSMDVPLTFADFAATEGRFRKHFKKATAETWGDEMVPLHEFLDLDADEREGRYPYIWAVDEKNHLVRMLMTEELARSAEERRQFWRQLKSLAGLDQVVDVDKVARDARADMAQKLTASLMAMAASGTNLANADRLSTVAPATAAAAPAAGSSDFEPVWIDTPECTSCDECIEINPKIFAYDETGLAYVVDPTAGPYKDIVRAAEKCTAGAIHPGTPFKQDEKGLDKLMQRAAKYQ